MASNIILETAEIVVCPNCAHKFPIEQGIAIQTIEQYKDEYQKYLQESSKEFEKHLSEESEKRINKLKEDTKAKFEEERKALQVDLDEKELKIKTFRENELRLLKEQKQLEEDKQNFELEQERELKKARREIEEKAAKTESQKFELREAEYKKQLEDVQKVNAALTRKLEQGSQQLQGEIFELALEGILRESFPYDDIKRVAKGTKGADILQCVSTQSGQICGTIIWEAKRAQSWSAKWLQKIKDDCRAESADIPVIVSTSLPKDCKDVFTIIDGVWLCRKEIVRPVAEMLRIMLIQTSSVKIQNEGQTRKADLIYNYLGSPQFSQNLRSVFESFASMQQDLDREKNAMFKTWKKREGQLDRVAVSMSTMVGQIQGIAQNSLPELDNIPQLQLPEESDEE